MLIINRRPATSAKRKHRHQYRFIQCIGSILSYLNRVLQHFFIFNRCSTDFLNGFSCSHWRRQKYFRVKTHGKRMTAGFSWSLSWSESLEKKISDHLSGKGFPDSTRRPPLHGDAPGRAVRQYRFQRIIKPKMNNQSSTTFLKINASNFNILFSSCVKAWFVLY